MIEQKKKIHKPKNRTYVRSYLRRMDTTTAIRIFLKQTLIQHKIPFEIIQENLYHGNLWLKVPRQALRTRFCD